VTHAEWLTAPVLGSGEGLAEETRPKAHQRTVSVGTRLAAGTTVLVAAIAVLIYVGLTHFQWHTMVAGKSATATMVGKLFREVVSTAIVFDDSKGIDEAIHSLMANEDVLYVRIDKLALEDGIGSVLVGRDDELVAL